MYLSIYLSSIMTSLNKLVDGYVFGRNFYEKVKMNYLLDS